MASGNSTGPGAIRTVPGTIVLNGTRTDSERISLHIVNTGDRPVQIGSHLHLPDSNTALEFDRALAVNPDLKEADQARKALPPVPPSATPTPVPNGLLMPCRWRSGAGRRTPVILCPLP